MMSNNTIKMTERERTIRNKNVYMINRKHHINYCLSLLFDDATRRQILQTHTHTYCSIASFLNSNWNFTMVNFITDSNAYSNSYLIISSLFFFLFNILYSPHHVTHTQIQTCTQNFTFSSIENSFGVTMHKSQKM